MARLVVHVGPPKTATTYFQQALFANADVLAAHGVYLPNAARLELAPKAVCHHHLAWDLMDSPRFRPDIGGWDALTAELATVDAETVLISSEVLSPSVIFTRGLGDALDERLLSLGRDVTILYVVRDQLSLINSSYAQEAKTLTDLPDFPNHASTLLRRGAADLERQTSRWYESSEIAFVAVPFSQLSESNPVMALLRAADIDVAEQEQVIGAEPVNITLGPIAVEAFRLLRSYLGSLNPSLTHDDMAVRRLHRIAARHAKELGWCDDPYWGWPPALAARAAELLADSNERFAQAVWGTAWPMPLPVDRAPTRVQLLKLPADDLDLVHGFVVDMAKRYAKLRAGTSKQQ